MSKVLIIGAGGVGGVVTHKCAQVPDVFSKIVLASRTLSRCQEIQRQVREMRKREIEIDKVDADDVAQTVKLLRRVKPDLVINTALPYQDLPIMDACLEAGVDYLDTANYEPRDVAKFEYKWQWAYHERYRKAGIMALLGSGFDPGVTNVFCAYAQKHLFDSIHTIDILDCNAGKHGHPFATNFNPEINIREITQRGRYWEKGEWQRDRSSVREHDVRLPGGRAVQGVPALPRGAGVAGQAHPRPRAHPLLDDLLGPVHHAPARARERRHDADRCGRLRGTEDRPAQVPQGGASGSVVAGPALRGQDGYRLPHRPARRRGRSARSSSTTSAITPPATRRCAPRPSRTPPASRPWSAA